MRSNKLVHNARAFLNIFTIAIIFTMAGIDFELQAQESVYNSILKTGGLFEKKNLGVKLSTYKSKSLPFIKLLLNDKSYWNRISGIEAAKGFADAEVDEKILNMFRDDHMTTSETKQYIQDRYSKFESKFIELYRNEFDTRKKQDLLRLIMYPIPSKTQKMLKEEIEQKNEKNREIAFGVFTNNANKIKNINPYDSYIRNYLQDPTLRVLVIDYIQANGSKQDLPIFLEILDSEKSSFKEKSVALRALRDWASINEQRKYYEEILTENSPNDSLKYIVIQVLPYIKSEKIRTNLCELSQRNSSQEIRITAALALISYDNALNIPCLEKIAIEKIDPKPPANLGDAIIVIMTFGISGFKNARDEQVRRQNFTSNQTKIREHLNYLKKTLEE
ncbi:HEAT repeat domain-containing protein [Leptospira sp. GIMC2001]|uniref:HEAT repeat domain-containing protein n=1 Tax=Leptospira sp. GIMC2001 TaxID=1513297 RepID=UPI002349DABF|nr:HEAT repeat domain-containing protein [Leptospira sp. GIMC2001]WCL49111.1 HEAT repeat domain-containing protein [Leptospira sp. GIMC2001]